MLCQRTLNLEVRTDEEAAIRQRVDIAVPITPRPLYLCCLSPSVLDQETR